VYFNNHVFCCAFGLMLFPWIIYVSNNSYAYFELKCISFLNACGLYNSCMSYVKKKWRYNLVSERLSLGNRKVALQFGIRVIKPW
jgi:hypothetical protein